MDFLKKNSIQSIVKELKNFLFENILYVKCPSFITEHAFHTLSLILV